MSDVFSPWWNRLGTRPTRTAGELKRLLEPPPFELPEETRFSGHWIVAAQGMGKSNLLAHMLASDLQKDACVITLDYKGDLTNRLRHLDLGDRLIVLDPLTAPFALNPLDVPKGDTKRAINQIEYIFGAMLGASVTPKQQALLRSLLRACIIGFPNPTLHTIQNLIILGPGQYLEYIAKLPPDLKHLFDTSKGGEWSSYDSTRSELKWRMRLLLETDLIQTMFLSPRTRFQISDAMDNGNVVVIDCSEATLHEDGAKFLGRYFIAQIWAAATARASRPPHKKKPVYVYVDEADAFIDPTVAEIIDRCRSQNIAIILAHQRRSQIDDKGVSGALENCAIKMANVDAEAAYFSKLLHIPSESMNQLKKGQFATYVRDLGSSIIDIPLASLPFEEMTDAEEEQLVARMRYLYGVQTHEPPPKDEGSHVVPRQPAEADTLIVPDPPSSTRDRGEKPPGWDK